MTILTSSPKKRAGRVLGAVLIALSIVGCKGDDGSDGRITGTLTGSVTNSANGSSALAGATVTLDPAVAGVTITTDVNGDYSATVPVGLYELTCSATNFTAGEDTASVLGGVTHTVDFDLVPTSPVVVTITGAPSSSSPGDAFSLTATVTPLDGSTVTGYAWTQTHSADATIGNDDTATATITLGSAAAYKAALLEALDLPERFEVLGIEPFALEEGGLVAFECEVTTTSGTHTSDVEVHTDLGFAARASGLRNVPTGVPVLLNAPDQTAYDWTIVGPTGSTATLMDATTANAYFTPDVAGLYTLTVFDEELSGDIDLEIYAADWVGAINGQNVDGRPTTTCTATCHAGIFPEVFDDWADSGHAEIFTNNLNTGGHYSSGCFDCHMVGYDPTADNNGVDDVSEYDAFMAAMFPGGQSHPDDDNWDTVLADFPEVAQMANIQCENCHGPNGEDGAHFSGHDDGDPRMSTSAQVCATCHGEPLRHARFQQWEESGHGNYETAIDESSGSCAKCHTAQGFLEWFENDLDVSYSTSSVDDGVAQPITCVVCHDPHNVGTMSGDGNDVEMRVDGDSPELLGGFTAYGLGHGAMCIVCHNTRRGLANDTAGLPDTGNFDRAPHGGAQGDLLMGENAFFVSVGARGGHSYVTDSCSTCHMEITDPPADLSYNLSGTNHTFEADTSICAECHGAYDASALIDLNDSRLAALADDIEAAILAEIRFHTDAPNNDTVQVTGDVDEVETEVDITSTSVIGVIELSETHGRVAMSIIVDGVLYEHVRLSSDTELLSSGDSLLDNSVTDNSGLVLAKAGWNYFLIHNDGSHGIHNPEFVNDIFVNTASMIDTTWP